MKMTINLMYQSDIINDVLIADTFIKRLCGYMFRSKPHHKAIIIKPCSSIHTFFMKFDIDIIFANENMKVIKKVEGLKPGRVIMPIKDANMVIEGEAGAFKNIDIGDNINITF
jgi:uncharacterized protein